METILKKIQYGIIALTIIFIYLLINNYLKIKEENKILKLNQEQLMRIDSIGTATIVLKQNELNDYIDQNNKLKAIIKKNDIKESRIKSVKVSDYKYKDKTKKSYNGFVLMDKHKAINPTLVDSTFIQYLKSLNLSSHVIDSTKCMKIEGDIKLQNGEISFDVTNREFNNKTTAVAYWQRREWKFLWFKTRFLGKKETVVKIVDECGETKILEIIKQEKS